MAYFVMQVMSGRELIVKDALTRAIHNHKRTDINEVIVPSQTVMDLTKLEKCKTNNLVALPSYVFISTDTPCSSFDLMDADLYNFLIMIPNVQRVINYSVEQQQMIDFLSVYADSEVVSFSILEKPKDRSGLMKAIEQVRTNKITKAYKQYVQLLAMRKNKRVSFYHIEETAGDVVVTMPFRKLKELLVGHHFTLHDLIHAPQKLLEIFLKENISYGY